MVDFAGIMRFTYNGTPITVQAKVEVEPTDASYTVEHNQNGSFNRQVKPQGPVWDIEFVDSKDGIAATSLPWNDIMAGGPYNLNLVEETTEILHSMTGGSFIGRPRINRMTGIVTGIQLQGAVGSYLQSST